jgi:FdhD protein
MHRVEPMRIRTDGGAPVPDPCDVAVEEVLTIMVEGVGNFAVMCTPCDAVALAVGFAFAEGMISSAEDVIQATQRVDPHVVAMRLEDPQRVETSRNLIVTSSCGLCGSRNIDSLMAGLMASKDSLRTSGALLRGVAEEMRRRQRLFTRTGCTHASAIFSASGEIVAFAEDIGRHSSLDKAIGYCLLDEHSLEQRGVMLSGRVSLELVAKSARAGIEIIAAVSAPTSLAIRAAERCNITLCAFVRGDRATVYTHPRRIRDVARPPE